MFNKKYEILTNKLNDLRNKFEDFIYFKFPALEKYVQENIKNIENIGSKVRVQNTEIARLQYEVDLIMKYLNVKEVNYPPINRLESKE